MAAEDARPARSPGFGTFVSGRGLPADERLTYFTNVCLLEKPSPCFFYSPLHAGRGVVKLAG